MKNINCPHCNTQIDEHEASRCLDAWVANEVMGWRGREVTMTNILLPPQGWERYFDNDTLYGPPSEKREWDFDSRQFYNSDKGGKTMPIVPHYSASIAAAWEVAEKLADRWPDFNIGKGWDEYTGLWVVSWGFDGHGWATMDATTAPLAICRAALKAMVSNENI